MKHILHTLAAGAALIPTEGYGFGNGAAGSFGPPGFKAASIAVAGETTVRLPIGY